MQNDIIAGGASDNRRLSTHRAEILTLIVLYVLIFCCLPCAPMEVSSMGCFRGTRPMKCPLRQ